jgi:hypothetical protein
MHYTACVWCSQLVRVKEPPKKGHDTVCSKACQEKEIKFRQRFSDEQIGLRNYREHGINPNHRGRQK